MKNPAVLTTIDNLGQKTVSRRTEQETRVAVTLGQETGYLTLWLIANKNGAITLEAEGQPGVESATLFSGRVLADNKRNGTDLSALALLEVRKTATARTGHEEDPDWQEGFNAGIYSKPFDLGRAEERIADRSAAWRAGYVAALEHRHRGYMAQLHRLIKVYEDADSGSTG